MVVDFPQFATIHGLTRGFSSQLPISLLFDFLEGFGVEDYFHVPAYTVFNFIALKLSPNSFFDLFSILLLGLVIVFYIK